MNGWGIHARAADTPKIRNLAFAAREVTNVGGARQWRTVMTENRQVRVTSIVDSFVGEITGLDLASGADADAEALLTRAHGDFPVLAIRDQSLDAESFMAFGRIFGDFEIDHHVAQFQDRNHREVVYLTNRDAEDRPDPASAERGAAWHVDSTFKAHPCAHTALYAMKIPSRGAGTLFADMYRAYETLPAELKHAIEGRQAKHKFSAGPAEGGVIPMTEEQDKMHPPVVHPMVRNHPATGRKALNVNPLHVYGIIGMAQDQAAPLLERIFAHALDPEFQYRHDYRVGDLVIWDQRCTWHKAEAAYPMDEHRLLMRVKIAARADG
jgi:taurine dioxygenase